MESEEEVVVDEHFLAEEQIELFDWEDHLYESWLEEKQGRFPRSHLFRMRYLDNFLYILAIPAKPPK